MVLLFLCYCTTEAQANRQISLTMHVGKVIIEEISEIAILGRIRYRNYFKCNEIFFFINLHITINKMKKSVRKLPS